MLDCSIELEYNVKHREVIAILKITLKAARAIADMSQEQVANELGVTRATISNWENNKKKIKKIEIDALCTLYKVPKEYIFLEKPFD